MFVFSGRFTPSGGGRSRRAVGGRGNAGSRGYGGGSKSSSRGASEEPSASSESGSSDNESGLSRVCVMLVECSLHPSILYIVHDYSVHVHVHV